MKSSELKTAKMTRLQANVIEALKNGWELGKTHGINRRWWIQQGGLGRGGKSFDIHANIIEGLKKRGLIEEKEFGFPISRWGLVEKDSG